MWRRVDLVRTHVSEERIASIFRVEKSASKEPVWAGCLQPPGHVGSSLADLHGATTQKMAFFIFLDIKEQLYIMHKL
jgi:hypothetical protein